jgi:5'-nucleotidase
VAVILLTNDDGIEAEGLKILENVLSDLASIVVVAPHRERSAVSHGITIHSPIKVKECGEGRYALNGTPADCILYALKHLFSVFPDMVISGINHGANLGDDIMYSGTIAAAREATRYGIPSMALSQAYDDRPPHFKEGAAFARELVAGLLEKGLNGEFCLNVNFPVRKIRGLKITRQGCSQNIPHFNSLDKLADLDVSPKNPETPPQNDLWSDRRAIANHYVSITPLQRDQTDYPAVRMLVDEAESLFPIKIL